MSVEYDRNHISHGNTTTKSMLVKIDKVVILQHVIRVRFKARCACESKEKILSETKKWVGCCCGKPRPESY